MTQIPDTLSADVAIVGYGPVGQCLAGLLARQGLDVIVIERHPTKYGRPRAGHFDGETMRVFQHLGIAGRMELLCRPMITYELVTPEWEVLERIALGEGDQGWKSSYLFYQPELEDVLDANSRALGARVFMGVSALDFVQDDSGVTLTAARTGREHEGTITIRAKFVVGADGARSFVRGKLGVEREDLGFPAVSNLVLDFEHADPDRDIPRMGDVRQVLNPARPQLSGRWNGSRWSRWEFLQMPGETREFLESEETCWALLAPWGVGPGDGTIIRRTVYTFEGTLAHRWRTGRVMIVGDAAHTMPPFMGQGMCSGIRDAANLSWKLQAILAGRADLSLLDSYQTERMEHVRALTEHTMAIGKNVIVTDPEERRRRDAEMRAGVAEEHGAFPRITGGITRAVAGAPQAEGRPAPQYRVAQGERIDRLDEFLGHGWRIVTRHPLPEGLFDARQARFLDGLGVTFAHVSRGAVAPGFVDIDSEYDAWFWANEAKAFIERPDHYVFGLAGSVADLPGLVDELAAKMAANGWRMDAAAATAA